MLDKELIRVYRLTDARAQRNVQSILMEAKKLPDEDQGALILIRM